jgi:hypothetical protein
MKYLLLILLLIFGTAGAQEIQLDLNLNLIAYHWDRRAVQDKHLNEVNPGIGLSWISGDIHKIVGVYKNSDSTNSIYALLAYTPIKIGTAKLGVVGGVVTGYAAPYTPAAGFYAVLPVTERISVNITAVPDIKSIKCYGFAGFQLSFKL